MNTARSSTPPPNPSGQYHKEYCRKKVIVEKPAIAGATKFDATQPKTLFRHHLGTKII